MRIKTKISQSRRDFHAVYECEFCGAVKRDYGYDDANFHENVIPAMMCTTCGKASGSPSSSPDVPAGVVL
jgi:hypothetical protein